MEILTYTRKDIIRRSAEKMNLSNDETRIVFESILDVISDMLLENHSKMRIELRNFGIFEIKPTKEKTKARNPRTNEEFYVPPRRKINFKPGRKIRESLQKEWII